mmetsp:Transcript_3424/g.7460  ORF Transcript_3424/g.7460 Transcript_3424/m.7460 type:complete len:117 (+) Transcript_3424:80-430(+)
MSNVLCVRQLHLACPASPTNATSKPNHLVGMPHGMRNSHNTASTRQRLSGRLRPTKPEPPSIHDTFFIQHAPNAFSVKHSSKLAEHQASATCGSLSASQGSCTAQGMQYNAVQVHL